jgi:DNA mismatch endonuclease (patch repair protein)
MADKFSPEKRSYIMSQIRSKNTSPETIVFNYLRKEKVYFQKHYNKVAGSPDIALPRKKRAVFIDGDFWHGYTLERRKATLPTYWSEKIIRNVKRDKLYRRTLRNNGWVVLRVWEHELNNKQLKNTLALIKEFLASP